jgi:hypothetical protein
LTGPSDREGLHPKKSKEVRAKAGQTKKEKKEKKEERKKKKKKIGGKPRERELRLK